MEAPYLLTAWPKNYRSQLENFSWGLIYCCSPVFLWLQLFHFLLLRPSLRVTRSSVLWVPSGPQWDRLDPLPSLCRIHFGSFHYPSSYAFWLQLWWISLCPPHFCIPTFCVQICDLRPTQWSLVSVCTTKCCESYRLYQSTCQGLLTLFFKRFSSNRRRRFFVRQWRGNGTICTVDGSNVVFSSSF